MTAALSLLSASALAIALLVPLRDDRRGNRATVGGNAPLRPLFPARDPAPDGEPVPSAVSIRFGGEASATAPVEVLSRIVRDAPETAAPIESEAPEPDDPVTAMPRTTGNVQPATRGGFTFRALAAALGFYRPTDRDGQHGTSEPEDDAIRDEMTASEASAAEPERSFADEVERLSEATAPIARDGNVHFSAMPVASEAPDRTKPTSAVASATADIPRKPFAEAAERSVEASVFSASDAVAPMPGTDALRASDMTASVRADARTPATNAPPAEGANIPAAAKAEASVRGADARTPATEGADTTEASNASQGEVRSQTDAGHAAFDGEEVGVAVVDVAPAAPLEQGNEFAASRSQAMPIPIDRVRPPLTRLPLRPKREEISWPRSLSEANGEWNEAARHDFLRRAAERRDPELERILCAAFREESATGRLLALRALAHGSAAGTHAIFIEALRRGSDEERALAVDVFGERGDRDALVEALSDRLDAIAARAALACFEMSSRADLERALVPLVDRARSDAILGLLAGVLQ